MDRIRGRRFDNEPKLNMKKVFATFIAIDVFVMVIVSLVNLFKEDEKNVVLMQIPKKYFSTYENGKYGVIDGTGKEIVKPVYDEIITIPNNSKGLFVCVYDQNYQDGTFKTKVLNEKNQEILKSYSNISCIENSKNNEIWFEDNILKYSENGLYGLVDFSGKKIVPAEYSNIYALDGISKSVVVEKDGLKGLVNTSMGEIIVKPEYAEISTNDSDLIKGAKSGILMDATSGKIIFEKNKDEKVAVASMTKMVAQIIILEKIEDGTLSWDEIVTASSNASGMGGSQIYLQTGEKMTVKDLLKGITMASANDATVAMAEKISGTESQFVKLMNEKVKSLGLKNTVFKNSTGLDEEGHYSTAYDMAIIAKELLTHEEILKFSSVYEDYLRVNTPNKFWLVNTNKLVRFYEGADGLKTGFTDNAKYCMAVTAKRDNMRLIAIVLGESTGKIRNQETMELLDYGFNLYKVDLIKSKDDVVGNINLDKADKKNVNVYPIKDITILGKKSDVSLNYSIELKLNKLELPINNGSVVGIILVKSGNKTVLETDAIVKEKIDKIGFIRLFGKTLKDIIIGNI